MLVLSASLLHLASLILCRLSSEITYGREAFLIFTHDWSLSLESQDEDQPEKTQQLNYSAIFCLLLNTTAIFQETDDGILIVIVSDGRFLNDDLMAAASLRVMCWWCMFVSELSAVVRAVPKGLWVC